MAAVIKLTNILVSNAPTKPEVDDYLKSFGDDCKNYLEGEYKRS